MNSQVKTWALVPVKRLENGKSRLAPVLSPQQRQDLQRALLADLLFATGQAHRLAGTLIVGQNADLVKIAHAFGAEWLGESDPQAGLNAAVAYGAEALQERGARQILVLPADLPLLRGAAIDAFLAATLATELCGIAGDQAESGTNALAFPASAPPAFRFGDGSFAKHCASLPPMTCIWRDPAFALDIDHPADLNRAATGRPGSHMAGWLAQNRICKGVSS